MRSSIQIAVKMAFAGLLRRDCNRRNQFDIVTPTTPNGAAVIDFIASRAFAPGRRRV